MYLHLRRGGTAQVSLLSHPSLCSQQWELPGTHLPSQKCGGLFDVSPSLRHQVANTLKTLMNPETSVSGVVSL